MTDGGQTSFVSFFILPILQFSPVLYRCIPGAELGCFSLQ